MDIKAKIEEIVNKIKNDKDVSRGFQEDPVKTVEGLVGVDLPDDQVNGIVDAVKAKIAGGAILDKVGGLFKKN